ncbi:hypothetical protein [Ralstonia solanacearum]|uniref:hypothetical protein n=1 Tax=Ralstonia solanacearum TaxID=305 RepID=UPI001FF7677F
MDAIDDVQTVLVLNERARTVLPYSTNAFKVSTGSKSRVLYHHLGELVVYRDGSVFRLEAVHFYGYFGERIWQRVFSFANGGIRQISVKFGRVGDFNCDEIKRRILDFIQLNPALIDQYFKEGVDFESTIGRVKSAMNCMELFDALEVPAPQDSLDLLS